MISNLSDVMVLASRNLQARRADTVSAGGVSRRQPPDRRDTESKTRRVDTILALLLCRPFGASQFVKDVPRVNTPGIDCVSPSGLVFRQPA